MVDTVKPSSPSRITQDAGGTDPMVGKTARNAELLPNQIGGPIGIYGNAYGDKDNPIAFSLRTDAKSLDATDKAIVGVIASCFVASNEDGLEPVQRFENFIQDAKNAFMSCERMTLSENRSEHIAFKKPVLSDQGTLVNNANGPRILSAYFNGDRDVKRAVRAS